MIIVWEVIGLSRKFAAPKNLPRIRPGRHLFSNRRFVFRCFRLCGFNFTWFFFIGQIDKASGGMISYVSIDKHQNNVIMRIICPLDQNGLISEADDVDDHERGC